MTHSVPSQPSLSPVRLAKRLGWLGSLSMVGMVSSGLALAQTAPADVSHSDPAPAAESAPTVELLPSDQILTAPAPIAPPETSPELSVPGPIVTQEFSAPVAAPDRDESPSTLVFSERSSGCQTVVQYSRGNLNDSCAVPPAPPTPIARTVSGVSSVAIGPLSVGPGGLSVATTPTARDYYNRTIRPPGRLGNGNIRLMFPLAIPAPITSMFGWRTHPISGDQRFHSGTDLGAPMGTPVLAAYAGRVAIADLLGGYGLAVSLEHNKGTQQTLYAHLSEIFVKPGEWVKQGDVIGRVGSTGNSTGPHLHFEFRQLTPEGWVALDAGTQLEYALAQLVKAMQTAQVKPTNPQG